MAIHYTPAPETESSRRIQEYLAQTILPVPEIAEEDRVTDSLYEAAAKGDRAEFHRLWTMHVTPLAKKAEAAPETSSADQRPSAPTSPSTLPGTFTTTDPEQTTAA